MGKVFLFFTLCFVTVYLEAKNIGPIKTNNQNISTKESSQPQENVINRYSQNFSILCQEENWKEILSQGNAALEEVRTLGKTKEEAIICAQLTSTAFFQGNYSQALQYAQQCHNLSEEFEDFSFYLESLYLESAIYRAFASKNMTETAQQECYHRAVKIAETAADIYFQKNIKNVRLLGTIYFNLGAAYADNPKGNLDKAIDCYCLAFDCFKSVEAINDLMRTSIRLGKVYLLLKKYEATQKIIDEIRPKITNKRIAMHYDYLEAQLNLSLNKIQIAKNFTLQGLRTAKTLGAKEDKNRLTSLLKKIEECKKNDEKQF